MLLILAIVGLLASLLALTVLFVRGVDVFGDSDARLDERSSLTAGEVIAIEDAGWPLPDDVRRAEFRFRHAGQNLTGTCFVAETTTIGPCTVEFAPGDPSVHRVRDGWLDPVESWTRAVFGYVLLPSLVIFALAFRRRPLARLREAEAARAAPRDDANG